MNHNIWWWIGLVCFLGLFIILWIQTQFGESDRIVRVALTKWSAQVAGDWGGLLRMSVDGSERLLSHLLGWRVFSIRAVATAFAIAFLTTYVAYQVERSRSLVGYNYRSVFKVLSGDWVLLFINASIDTCFLNLGRLYLRAASTQTRRHPIRDIVVPFVFAFASIYLAMFVAALFAAHADPEYFQKAIVLFKRFEYWFRGPHGFDDDSTVAMRLYFLPAAFSSLVFFAIFVMSNVLYLIRRIAKKPLEDFLSWLTNRRANLLTLATSLLALVAVGAGLLMG